MKKVGITPGPVKFENMEPNDVKQFTPSNTGTEGQILKKTSNGYNWQTPPDVKEFNPSNTGTEGQILTKTNDGYNWATPSGGGGSDIGIFVAEHFDNASLQPISHGDIIANNPETFNAIIELDADLNIDGSSYVADRIRLRPSVVFCKIPDTTYGYYANCSVHENGLYNNTTSINPLIVNLVFNLKQDPSDNTRVYIKTSATVVYNKENKNITLFNVSVKRISICVNQ